MKDIHGVSSKFFNKISTRALIFRESKKIWELRKILLRSVKRVLLEALAAKCLFNKK